MKKANIAAIVCLLFFFPVGLYIMWAKTNWNKKVKWGITGILGFFTLISLIGSVSSSKSNTNTTASSQTAKVTAKPTEAQVNTPIPSSATGLNITRDSTIADLQKIDPSLNFQPSSSVNGIERYMAVKGQNGIELYGQADNLTEVTSTALFGNTPTDLSGNAVALVYIIGVANVMDTGSKAWVTSTLEEISTAWQKGQNSVKKSTVIEGKKFEMSALKTDALDTISLTIYSSQDSTPPTETKTGSNNPLSDPNAFPGLTKVKLNASLDTNAQGMTFTNNENKDWKNCIVTINPEDGASNWYEYDFGDIAAHQAYTLIPWEKLKREDSTTFDHSTMTAKTIELYCELGETTIGLADFTGK